MIRRSQMLPTSFTSQSSVLRKLFLVRKVSVDTTTVTAAYMFHLYNTPSSPAACHLLGVGYTFVF